MNTIISFLGDSTFFGIFLSIGLYLAYDVLCKKAKSPLLNPLFLSLITIIMLLVIFNVPYESYEPSGDFIAFFLTPATVCFAVPLYRQIQVLRQHPVAILVSIFTGSLASVLSIFITSKIMSLPVALYASLVPKSVTTPIALSIAEEMGGMASCAMIAVFITGITGAIFAIPLGKLIKLESDVALGLATGTASHAVGTSAVMEKSSVAGAMGSLSIALAGVMTVVLVPIISMFY